MTWVNIGSIEWPELSYGREMLYRSLMEQGNEPTIGPAALSAPLRDRKVVPEDPGPWLERLRNDPAELRRLERIEARRRALPPGHPGGVHPPTSKPDESAFRPDAEALERAAAAQAGRPAIDDAHAVPERALEKRIPDWAWGDSDRSVVGPVGVLTVRYPDGRSFELDWPLDNRGCPRQRVYVKACAVCGRPHLATRRDKGTCSPACRKALSRGAILAPEGVRRAAVTLTHSSRGRGRKETNGHTYRRSQSRRGAPLGGGKSRTGRALG